MINLLHNFKKISHLFVVLVLCLFNLETFSQENIFYCGMEEYIYEEDTLPPFDRGGLAICTDTTFVRYIGVHYHFIQNDNATGNFNRFNDGTSVLNGYSGYKRAKEVIELANSGFSNTLKMRRPIGNNLPIPDVNIQYVLLGVHFHQSSFHRNSSHFTSMQTIDNLFGEDIGNSINVYEVASGQGSGRANTISGTSSIPSRLFTVINGYDMYLSYPNWMAYQAGTLNHEVGHLFGLWHTWPLSGDGCSDTPIGEEYDRIPSGGGCLLSHANCWAYNPDIPGCPRKPCDDWGKVSNNLMDYNEYFPHAISPCQVNRMNVRLASSLNDYIYSCDGCAPPKCLMYLTSETPCITGVFIDASASMNYDEYLFEICKINSSSNLTCTGGYFNTGWNNGEIERVRLDAFLGYEFEKNTWYKITMKVASSECPGVSEVTRVIKTLNDDPPCISILPPGKEKAVEILSLYPNPVSGININIEYEVNINSEVSVKIYDSNSQLVKVVENNVFRVPGIYTVQGDISGMAPGNYIVQTYGNGIPDTQSFLRIY
jgi:hypothetical protein